MSFRLAAIALLLIAFGCSGHSGIPADVSYSIIEETEAYNAITKKRMVDIRLNQKVSPDVLRTIALKVKSAETKEYERTLIFLYLPEVVPGVQQRPWATCHFNPTLDVQIIGSTQEQDDALRTETITHPGKRIGAWIVPNVGAASIHLIYEDGGRPKLSTIAGQDRFDADMTELPAQEGRRFQVKGSSEVYSIDSASILRMYNREGKVFAAATPLK